MGGKQKEACGRCSVTTVIDATEDEETSAENPFEGERIEVEEEQMRSVVRHEVLASKVTDKLDSFASRFVWGK
jgi:hypothetical protein